MADQLATPGDLASLLQKDIGAINMASATLAIEVCTAVVQAAAGGQRIVLVAGDTVTLYGGDGRDLRLPQRPIVSIESVTYDGTLLGEGTASGTWRRTATGLWRDLGWSECAWEPAAPTVVVYTHGYIDGAQDLQLGRGTVLSLARGLSTNPDGTVREQIDDYSVAYEKASAALDASPSLKALLRRQYGRRAAMVRVA